MAQLISNSALVKGTRKVILFALLTVAVFCLFSTPLEDSTTWALDLLLSKAISAIAFALFAWLSHIWNVRWSY